MSVHTLRSHIASQIASHIKSTGHNPGFVDPDKVAFLLQVVPIPKISSDAVPRICLPAWPLRLSSAGIDLSGIKIENPVEFVTRIGLDETNTGPCLQFDIDHATFARHTLGAIASANKKPQENPKGLLAYTEVDNVISEMKRKKLIVEFSSPNIAKPFHAGHLRSTVIGNFVANIQTRLGHDVIRINYFGDWGTQFGALLLGFQKYGSAELLKSKPLSHLLTIYASINKDMAEMEEVHAEAKRTFARLQDGDESLCQLWSRFCELSSAEYQSLYERLGVTFDVLEWESMYSQKSLDIVRLLLDQAIAHSSADNSVRADLGHDDAGHPVHTVIQKSDATSLYITRDLAAVLTRREKFGFDNIYYVVENGQHAHFETLRRLVQRMGHDWADRMVHVKFGRVNGMSTRRGGVVLLEDILDEAKLRLVDAMRKATTTKAVDLDLVGEALAVSCLIVHDFKSRRILGYDFKWDDVLQFKGESGLHLQYAYARLCSLEQKCEVTLNPSCRLDCLVEPAAVRLICHLARYDEILYHAGKELEPYIIVRYLFQLSHLTNSALKILTVKKQTPEVSEARLLLFHCSRMVLSDGLRLLGIQPLEAI